MKRSGFKKKGTGFKNKGRSNWKSKSNLAVGGKNSKLHNRNMVSVRSRSKLIRKADSAYSLYRRLSAADEYGMVYCYTCGKRENYRNVHLGHYRSRALIWMRWDPDNTEIQCFHCNITLSGNRKEFAQRMGEERLERIEQKASQMVSLSDDEIKQIIKKYESID